VKFPCQFVAYFCRVQFLADGQPLRFRAFENVVDLSGIIAGQNFEFAGEALINFKLLPNPFESVERFGVSVYGKH
jgi:hypothetical protein